MNWLELHPATISLVDAVIVAGAVAAAILASGKLAGSQFEKLKRDETREQADNAIAVQAKAVSLITLVEARLRRTGETLLGANGTSMVLSGRAHASLRLHERALTRFPFDELVGRDRLTAFEEAVGLTLSANNHVDEAKRAMEEVLSLPYAASEKARLLYETSIDCSKKISEIATEVAERARRLER